MLASIDFNDELFLKTEEVDDVRTNWVLPTESVPGKLLQTKMAPECSFGVRWAFSELPGPIAVQAPILTFPLGGKGQTGLIDPFTEQTS